MGIFSVENIGSITGIDPGGIVTNTGDSLFGQNLGGNNDPATYSNYADKLNAFITRDQYQYYKDMFIPEERAMKGQIRTPEEIESLTRNAGIRSDAAYKSAEGDFNRSAGRFGAGLSPDQKREAERLFEMEGKSAKGHAMTSTRSGLYDLNVQNRGEFVGLGRGIATGAQESLAASAAEQARINATNKQLDAQEDAAQMQTAGTIAGLGIAAYGAGLI